MNGTTTRQQKRCWLRKGIPCPIDGDGRRKGEAYAVSPEALRKRCRNAHSLGSRIKESLRASSDAFTLDDTLSRDVRSPQMLARDLELLLQDKISCFEMKIRRSAFGSDGLSKGSLQELVRDDSHLTANLCSVHLDVLQEYIRGNTINGVVLQAIYSACEKAMLALRATLESYEQLDSTQRSMKQEYLKITQDLHTSFASRAAEAKGAVLDSQREAAHLKQEVEQLRKQNAELKADLLTTRARFEEEERQSKLSQRVTKDTHEALRELQHRSNSVMEENTALRKIAQYNEDLLGELEELKLQVANAEHRCEQHDQRVVEAVAEKRRSVMNSKGVIRSLARTSKLQLEELQTLKVSLQQVQAELSDSNRQRDIMAAQCTPRPNVYGVQQALRMEEGKSDDLAPPNIEDASLSSRDRFRLLTQHAARLSSALEQSNRKHQVAENVAFFLKAENEGLSQRFESQIPAGRVFVGLGCNPLVPPYLRAVGSVKHKAYNAVDMRSLIRDLESWIDRQDVKTQAMPPAGLFQMWVSTRSAFDTQMETTYGMVDAGERMKGEADIVCFRRWLDGHASYKMLKGVLRAPSLLLEGLYRAEDANSKWNTTKGLMKRKFMWDHITSVCKTCSEVDLLRLRNALHRDMSKQMGVPESSVRFESIFSTDESGHSSDFVTVLRELYVHDADELRVEWENHLHFWSVGKQVTRALMVATLRHVEPALSPKESEAICDDVIKALPPKPDAPGCEDDLVTYDTFSVLSQSPKHFHITRISKRPDVAATVRRPYRTSAPPAVRSCQEELAHELNVSLPGD